MPLLLSLLYYYNPGIFDNMASMYSGANAEDEERQYRLRKEKFGIDTPQVVNAAAADPTAVWVDVRSEAEIVLHGRYVETDKKWVHATCTDDACPLLYLAAENLIKDKDAKIIAYCSSGRRAKLAKEVLTKKGYTSVVNAGGISDIAGRNKFVEA